MTRGISSFPVRAVVSKKIFISLAILSIFVISGTVASPRAYAFATGQPAAIVIGQSNFNGKNSTTPATASSILSPGQIAFDSSGDLWVADSSNGRVLEFKPPFSNGEAASTVLGSSGFTINPLATSTAMNQTNLMNPFGLAFDPSGNLWVSDETTNRIVEFKAPFSNGENESVVLGAANFVSSFNQQLVGANQSDLSSPVGMAFDSSGNLWVADQNYYRVVEFKAPLTTGELESTVIGQTNFTSGVMDIPGCPQSCSEYTSSTSLNGPQAVTFDSSGNLWVADARVGNLAGRVVEFKAPFSNGEAASIALGVAGLNVIPDLNCIEGAPDCITFPDSLAFDHSGNLWVSDDTAGRVLEFTQPFSFNQSASIAIGQPNTTIIAAASSSNAEDNATQTDLLGNDGIAFDPSGNLWVSDSLFNRVLEFSASVQGSATTSSSASLASSATSSLVTSPASSVSSTAASISSTSSQQSSTHATTSIVVASSSSSSSSTSISLNYLAVVAVVVFVMATTFIVVSRRQRK